MTNFRNNNTKSRSFGEMEQGFSNEEKNRETNPNVGNTVESVSVMMRSQAQNNNSHDTENGLYSL